MVAQDGRALDGQGRVEGAVQALAELSFRRAAGADGGDEGLRGSEQLDAWGLHLAVSSPALLTSSVPPAWMVSTITASVGTIPNVAVRH